MLVEFIRRLAMGTIVVTIIGGLWLLASWKARVNAPNFQEWPRILASPPLRISSPISPTALADDDDATARAFLNRSYPS